MYVAQYLNQALRTHKQIVAQQIMNTNAHTESMLITNILSIY